MKRPVILIVDDESDIRQTLVNFLNDRFDCVLKEAENGEEALKFVRENICDVMILDIKMPKRNGLSVMKEAKKLGRAIDIIIISAWESDDVAREALDFGATDYVIKPLDLKAVNLKLSNILEKRNQRISKI
ncbi:MAG: response regulator [Candidatus Omnitrophica bacterium]|nr:response regulator [Candidatus Omnitrophota bacterium]